MEHEPRDEVDDALSSELVLKRDSPVSEIRNVVSAASMTICLSAGRWSVSFHDLGENTARTSSTAVIKYAGRGF
jgi:hypothetical protein